MEYANDQRNGSLSFLQKSPKLLAFFKNKFLCRFCPEFDPFIRLLWIQAEFFIDPCPIDSCLRFLLEEISFLVEDDKRKAIDFGYWFIPIFVRI